MHIDSDNTDMELIEKSKNGDSTATDALIMKYRPTVEAIAMKYIGAPLEKDDLVQEGMIGLLAAINSYSKNKGAKFITYSATCVKNSIQNAIKKQSRMKDIPQNSIVTLEEDYMDNKFALSAEDEFLAKESVNILTDALYEQLSSFENEVLKLHIVGYSYNVIAEKLDKKPKAIDNAIQRIRKKLEAVSF